ncbi:MAG: hypothetical protein GY851_13730, partial [bacterium]|nr:hypothetical protein [bacterium]
AIIEDNDIHHNEAGTKGGGMYWIGAADIRHNRIYSNEAGENGGACAELGEADIYNNLVFDNYAAGNGGAFYDTLIMNVRHNTIYGNEALGYGGAFFEEDGTHVPNTVLENNIIWGNTATTDGNHDNAQIAKTVDFKTLRGNIIQGWTDAYNINSDPLLIDPDGADNDLSTASDNNFHIPSNSPATDAGVDCGISNDYERDERPAGTGHDIGAYEVPGYLSWDGTALDDWIQWNQNTWETTGGYWRSTNLSQSILFRANYCSDAVLRFSYHAEDLPSTGMLRIHLRAVGELFTSGDSVILSIKSSYMGLSVKENGSSTGNPNRSATTAEDTWYDVEVDMSGRNVVVKRRVQGGQWVTTHSISNAPEGTRRIQFATSGSAVVRLDDIMMDGVRPSVVAGGSGGPTSADGFDSGLVGWTTSGTWTTSSTGEDDAYATDTSDGANVYMRRTTIPGTTTALPDDFELSFSYKTDEYTWRYQYLKITFRKSTGVDSPSVGIWPESLNIASETGTWTYNHNYPTEPGRWYDVRIVCDGTSITVERRLQGQAWETIHSKTTTVTQGDYIEFLVINDAQYKLDDVAVVAR